MSLLRALIAWRFGPHCAYPELAILSVRATIAETVAAEQNTTDPEG